MSSRKLSPLEEALIRDDPGVVAIARATPEPELLPVLAKYAKPIHPFETRERVLECLTECKTPEALPIFVAFLESRPENDSLRGQAASVLSARDCSSISNDILKILTQDLSRLLEIAPAILGVVADRQVTLESFREDIHSLLNITDRALRQTTKSGLRAVRSVDDEDH